MSVPKIIHYCWFGGNPKPKLAEKCIKSWKKFCPDYQIIEWNEENFDVSAAPEYVCQAYAAKRWAFVTDYVRLKAMTEMGGIYMDTDVELVKPLTPFLAHDAFAGFETDASVQTGLLACCPGFPLFQEFLQHYDSARFCKIRRHPRRDYQCLRPDVPVPGTWAGAEWKISGGGRLRSLSQGRVLPGGL